MCLCFADYMKCDIFCEDSGMHMCSNVPQTHAGRSVCVCACKHNLRPVLWATCKSVGVEQYHGHAAELCMHRHVVAPYAS